MNQASNLLNSGHCFLPLIKHYLLLLTESSCAARKVVAGCEVANERWGSVSALGVHFPSSLPPAPEWGLLLPHQLPHMQLLTSHRHESPFQLKVCFALLIREPKARYRSPNRRGSRWKCAPGSYLAIFPHGSGL